MTGKPIITPLDAMVGTNVQKLREAKGISQEQFAEILGCSYGMVSLLETGKRAWKNKWIWAAIQYFKIEAAELFNGVVIAPEDKPIFEAMKKSIVIRNEIAHEKSAKKVSSDQGNKP